MKYVTAWFTSGEDSASNVLDTSSVNSSHLAFESMYDLVGWNFLSSELCNFRSTKITAWSLLAASWKRRQSVSFCEILSVLTREPHEVSN